jgi:hypothetical protein
LKSGCSLSRAAPRVDRLVIVAYHGKTRTLAHQQLHQLILAGVSSGRILKAANILIANNPHVFEKRLFSELGYGAELKVLSFCISIFSKTRDW